MEVLDIKNEIRLNVVSSFIKIHNQKVIVYGDTFDTHREELYESSPKIHDTVMASLIADCYERLKWKEPLGHIKSQEEQDFLAGLDNAKDFDEALALTLQDINLAMFLVELYSYQLMPISEIISAKNNLYSTKSNEIIINEDKLRFFGEFNLRNAGVVFSKKYVKSEYLSIYDYLYKACNGDETLVLRYFTSVVYGLSYYNADNFRKLIFDMCREFYFQKKVMDYRDLDNLVEEYLLFLICKAPNDQLLKIISEDRKLMENLVFSYMNYAFFENNVRDAIEQPGAPRNMRKILNKLSKGKMNI